MPATPTREAIIGTFQNGRSDQNDFLQLKSPTGGQIFGWIDYLGTLQGSLATGLINLPTGEVGFGGLSNNVVGDPSLTYSVAGGLIINTSAITALTVSEPTAATVGSNQSSPLIQITSSYWTGSAAAPDSWTAQDVLGSGANPTATLQIVHTGSTGQTQLALTNLTAATAGTQSQLPAQLAFSGNFWDGTALASKVGTLFLQESFAPGVSTICNLVFSFATTSGHAQGNVIFDGSISDVIISNNFQPNAIQGSFSTGSAGAVFPLSAAANASGGTTTYTGTITAGGQYSQGQNVTIAGFTNGANNGTFVVFSSSLTTLVVWNPSGVAESHAATVTAQTQYFNDAGYDYTASFGVTYNVLGTNISPVFTLSTIPNSAHFVLGSKGDSNDSAYFRLLNDGLTGSGSHGFEIGSIFDGTGASPIQLRMGKFSGFTGFVYPQPVVATSGANQSSYSHVIQSQYWTGSVTAINSWSIQDVLGSGANPQTILRIQQSGTSGAAAVSIVSSLFANNLTVTTATPTTTAGQVGLGTTTGFGNGTAGTGVTTTTKNTGSGPTTPQTIVDYLQISVGGSTFWIPLVQ